MNMFEYFDKDKMLVPIKIWAASIDDIEESCLEQAVHLANLPFAVDHIALMPDTHTGKGMPIGGVIACRNAVIPNAVGVDIGCGMAFVQTDIPVKLLRETMTGSGELIKVIIGDILRTIPVGFKHYSKPQTSAVLDKAQSEISKYSADEELIGYIEESYFSVGTLGGGNHFIEIQEDENGLACIMLHSGSRMFGNMIGQHFNTLAHSLNEKYFSVVPSSYNLPFLPVDTDEGQCYLNWMHLAMILHMRTEPLCSERSGKSSPSRSKSTQDLCRIFWTRSTVTTIMPHWKIITAKMCGYTARAQFTPQRVRSQ